MRGKRVTHQSVIGQLGANLIERIVLQMNFIWRPTHIFDVGIDGEIEICDPTTGEATNNIVKVQAKATTRPFPAETTDSFEYLCDQRDLDYWLRGNAPVVLILCRPSTDEAYFISIKDYFRDLSTQKIRKVYFNKQHDRFDVSCIQSLKKVALPKDSGIYFTPLQKTEKLYSNLLKVKSFSPEIYTADTDYRRPGDVWAKFKSMGVRTGGEWILARKQIVSFHNLKDYPFNAVCDPDTCDNSPSAIWAYADDEDKKREFVRLLNLSLRARNYLLSLRFNNDHDYFYFLATKNLETRKIKYRSIRRNSSREVFKKYHKKKDLCQTAFCRHSAFKGAFYRHGDDWYLEITPTYHFTSDGCKEDMYREEHLKGIKRLERNPAVLGHLLMWTNYLKRPIRSLFSAEYPFLSFGELATVDINVSLPDKVWYKTEEGDEARNIRASDNQLKLLGL